MSYFLTIGEEPTTIPKIIEVMRSCDRFPILCENWKILAYYLNLLRTMGESRLSEQVKCTLDNVEDLLSHLLSAWKENYGTLATLPRLGQALVSCGVAEIAGKLEIEFAGIVLQVIVAPDGLFVPGNLVKITDLFILNTAVDHPPNIMDRIMGFRPKQLANKLVCRDRIGMILQQLIDPLRKQQLKDLESFVFQKLSFRLLAILSKVELNKREDEARQILKKMNLTNLGVQYVVWFVVARAVLLKGVVADTPIRMRGIYENVFDVELDTRNQKDGIVPKFKHDLLVFFIDILVGLWKEQKYQLYKTQLNTFSNSWLNKYLSICLRTKAINLLKDIFEYPEILHNLVHNTLHLEQSQLELRKDLIQEKIKQDPGAVNVLDEKDLPPFMMKNVHVKLMKLLINKTCTDIERVNQIGRNFVHLAADYLPADQLCDLISYLVQLKRTSVLNARDFEQRTPLLVSMQEFDSKPDVDTVQHFKAGGTNFNASDKYELTAVYYAVKNQKSVRVLQALVEGGANWRWKTSDNRSLLHLAAWEGNLETVKYLVSIGLNVNATDANNRTPLHFATTRFNDGEDHIVSFLLEHGAKMINEEEAKVDSKSKSKMPSSSKI